MNQNHYTNLSETQQEEISRLSERETHTETMRELTALERQWLDDYRRFHS